MGQLGIDGRIRCRRGIVGRSGRKKVRNSPTCPSACLWAARVRISRSWPFAGLCFRTVEQTNRSNGRSNDRFERSMRRSEIRLLARESVFALRAPLFGRIFLQRESNFSARESVSVRDFRSVSSFIALRALLFSRTLLSRESFFCVLSVVTQPP